MQLTANQSIEFFFQLVNGGLGVQVRANIVASGEALRAGRSDFWAIRDNFKICVGAYKIECVFSVGSYVANRTDATQVHGRT